MDGQSIFSILDITETAVPATSVGITTQSTFPFSACVGEDGNLQIKARHSSNYFFRPRLSVPGSDWILYIQCLKIFQEDSEVYRFRNNCSTFPSIELYASGWTYRDFLMQK
jgi:hypothetical protein